MSTTILLKGTITGKQDVFVVSEKFRKQEIWMEIDQDTNWPHDVPVEFINDNIDKCVLHKYNVGDEIEVDVNVRGQYNKDRDKLFPKLQGWRLIGNPNSPSPNEPQQPSAPQEDNDDLPF